MGIRPLIMTLIIAMIIAPCLADSKIVSIDRGSATTFVIRSDGSVWSCGYNGDGNLGDGTTVSRCVLGPTLIDNARKIAVTNGGGVVLKNDGTVWTWGSNELSVRGYETTNSLTIDPVLNMTDVKDIFSSYANCFAIKEDGTVWAWGTNYRGCLGDGTDETRLTPVQVRGLPNNILAMASSGIHTLALDDTGKVWSWGNNSHGQLGDSTVLDSLTPKQLSISNVKSIAVGSSMSYALKNDGTIWAWGNNEQGALGDGTNTDRSTPVKVSGLTGVTSIATGVRADVLALKSDGSVWAWGLGTVMIGDNVGDWSKIIATPQKVNVTDIVAISGGSGYMVMKNDGSLWAWGRNAHGELGIGWFDIGDEDDQWGVFTPTKVLTEPGATPFPEITITPNPTITVTPIPVNNSDISINQLNNTSTSIGQVGTPDNVSAGQATTTMAITPSPTVSIKPDPTVSAIPHSTTSPGDTGIPYIEAITGICVLVLAVIIGFLAYIKILKK